MKPEKSISLNNAANFLYDLNDTVLIDEVGTQGEILVRCETMAPELDKKVKFYLILSEDGDETELTEDSLKAYNISRCSHLWTTDYEDKELNKCLKCFKKIKIKDCN